MIYTGKYQSPIGELWMASDGSALTGLWSAGQKYAPSWLFSDAVLPEQEENEERKIVLSDLSGLPVFSQTGRWLDRFFSGERMQVYPPLSFPGEEECLDSADLWKIAEELPMLRLSGTPFQQLVWQMLLEIPYGETITYGELAENIGRLQGGRRMSARAVGTAAGRNPFLILIPCHRLVGKQNRLTGYAAGIEKKEYLLSMEGSLEIV